MKTNLLDKEKLPIQIENIVPILSVRDMHVSRAFYVDLLGFKEATWGSDHFTHFGRDNGGIYVCQGAQGSPGAWIWIGFDGDMLSLYNQLQMKGVIIRQPPVNYSWALEMHVEDPDGNVLRLGTDPNENEPFIDQTK
jgi:catechol 2,3-dioxygenase-like lactoylglutathione lyase family enzyme